MHNRHSQASRMLPSLLVVAFLTLVVGSAWGQVSRSLSDSTTFKPYTPPEVKSSTAALVGRYNPNQMLRLTLGLQPPHIVEERKFLHDLQSKGAHDYHQFLTAAEWTKRFDPSAADEQAVVDWATSQGLTITHRFPNRLIVDVEGTASTIEKAFGVTINSYQVGDKSYFSNDRDPQIPAQLNNILHSAGGLNSFEVLKPANKNMPEPAFPDYSDGPAISRGSSDHVDGDRSKLPQMPKKGAKKQASGPQFTSGPPYDPQDMYLDQAYDANALYALGHCCNPYGNAGGSPPEASIAIATAGLQQGSDLVGFQSNYPYLAYYWTWFGIDGSPACCDGEGTMDLEWSTAMANSFGSYLNTAHVYMYDGVNSGFNTFNDIYNHMLTDGYARNFSTSWGWIDATLGGGNMDTADAIFSSMVGQGWSLTAASGDGGASYSCQNFDSVSFPASDPNVVAAGGTTMYMFGGPPPSFFSFSGWSGGPDGCGTNDGGSTGGFSSYWAEPSYQTGLPARGVPDIALNADWYNTPQYMYFLGGLGGNGGTSIVAPETVGFFAQENAYLLALGNICGSGSSPCAPMGAVNPYLYNVGYNNYDTHYPFYDVTTGCNNNDDTAFWGLGFYCAGTGWDAVTGWGQYNFLQLAWAINWNHVSGYSFPVVNFSGPATSKWYNGDVYVSWTVSTPPANSYPSPGTSGFSQGWDFDPGNPTSAATPGTGSSFYSGPQYANATSGCLDFTGTFCAGSIGGAQGWHYVNVRAWGNEGENGGDYSYGPLGYDTIAPTTTDTLSGTLSGSVYVSAVTNILSASDPAPGSGVASTVYQVNGGTLTTYSGAFNVLTAGVNSVTFHSTDVAGNVEGTKSVSFTIVSPTTTSLSSSANPAGLGKSVKFTAIVSPTLVGTPTGKVTFKDGATVLGTKTLVAGKAVLATTALTQGTHTITATYTGAVYFSGSSASVSETIIPVTLTPTSAIYKAQKVGTTSAAKTFTLANDQTVALTGIASSASGDFHVSATTCPSSLAAHLTCTISVTFKPTATGTRTGTLKVTDSASNSPQTASLTGTGK